MLSEITIACNLQTQIEEILFGKKVARLYSCTSFAHHRMKFFHFHPTQKQRQASAVTTKLNANFAENKDDFAGKTPKVFF